MIYFVIMYTSDTILDFNLICIFKLTFKRRLTSFKFLFCVFKTHIFNLIQIVLVKIRFNISMCFIFITDFLVFPQDYSINRIIKSSIILLLLVKFLFF